MVSTHPRGLKTLTLLIGLWSLVCAALFIAPALVWSKADWMRFAVENGFMKLPGGPVVFDTRAQLLGGLGALPRVALGLFALWQLWRLLGGVLAGRSFDPTVQRRLHRFAWAILLYNLLAPLQGAWESFAFTVGNPPGSHAVQVQLGLSSWDVLSILLSAVILAIAIALPTAIGRAPAGEASG